MPNRGEGEGKPKKGLIMVRSRTDIVARPESLEGAAVESRTVPPKATDRCDIYLAFAGMPALQPAGYLVTGKSSVSDVVAFCPLDPRRIATEEDKQREMARQLRLANEIAAGNDVADEAGDAIWLERLGSENCPAPHWIYGLSCMPLTRKWSGAWVHPVPFCPKMIAEMATQPKAAAWFRARQQQAS